MLTATYVRNIRKDKRICCQCGGSFDRYRGDSMVTTISRGKHLCRECEKERQEADHA
jgi:hypothetical protein